MRLQKLYKFPTQTEGFTLIELVMIIVLVSILSVVAVVKWPTGMDVSAATLEFKQAVRYAQHMALTREWTEDASEAWGMVVSGDKYYIGRANAGCVSSCSDTNCAEVGYCDRSLLGNSSITLSSAVVNFNGLGEPIAIDGSLLGNTTFTIGGSTSVTVCQQTGYVLDGASCP